MSKLLDLVYEQDYKKLVDDHPEVFSSETRADAIRAEKELLAIVRERFKEMPHYISPENQKCFDYCEGKLDRLALLKQGRIRSVVSYVNYYARITVEVENMIFAGETLEIFKAVSEKAQWIRFETSENGWMKLIFGIDYFANIGDKGAVVDQEMDEHPEACELNDAAYEEEKQKVLSIPKIYDAIKSIADELRMTPEEWYDVADVMLSQNPDICREVMEESLKQQRDKSRYECDPEINLT